MGAAESRLNSRLVDVPVGGSSDALVSDVRRRRNRIDELLDELGNRTHPRFLMRKAVEWVRSGDRRQEVKDMAFSATDSITEGGRDMSHKISEQGHKISEKISSLSQDAKASSRKMFNRRKTQAQEGLMHTREEMGHAKDRAASAVNDNPLLAALGCLGLGVAVGLMFPTGRKSEKPFVDEKPSEATIT